jgi:hypothetical protein
METKFRIRAHHAVTRLADALKATKSPMDCRRLADVFANMIGRARVSDGDFDLDLLYAEAKQSVRSER